MKKFLPSITSIITEQKRRILFAFDLDDTLIKTKANIIVYNGEETRTLTPAEYAIYEPQPGDEFDYSQFQGIKDPVIIKDTFELFSKILKTSKMLSNAKTIILTARTPSITSDLQKFLEKYNLPDVQLYAVGSSDPNKKADVIQDYIDKGFNSIRFYDDSPKNITAVKALEKTNPEVQIQAKLMKHDLTEVIRKVGDEYAVYPKKGGKRLGTHSTRTAAEKQLAAIHINKESKHEPMNPGILKKRLGKLSCTKVRKERQGLKDKSTTYAKALQRYLNYHCQ